MKRSSGVSLVDIMSEATGKPRRQLRHVIFKAVRDRCELHRFEALDVEGDVVWQCSACKWKPTRVQLEAYEQGLAHGRVHAVGGGRCK